MVLQIEVNWSLVNTNTNHPSTCLLGKKKRRSTKSSITWVIAFFALVYLYKYLCTLHTIDPISMTLFLVGIHMQLDLWKR